MMERIAKNKISSETLTSEIQKAILKHLEQVKN